MRRVDYVFRILEDLIAGKLCRCVAVSSGEGVARTGGGEGFEAQGSENFCVARRSKDWE